jgi:signal transduction histidine kinase
MAYSELAVPIRQRGKVIGVLDVESLAKDAFDEFDQEALLELAEDLALYLENLTLNEQLEEAAAASERSRLARELHDAVTQTIWSAALTAEVLPQVLAHDPKEGQRRLASLQRTTRGALAEMRTLLLELRPANLAQTELDTLLCQLGTSVTNRTGLPVAVIVEGQDDLPPDVKVALYRIAQEALNNITKHAQASGDGEFSLRAGTDDSDHQR